MVSVDQWGDIVSELGGSCTKVKTVLASSSVDPHDYEPSPSDAVAFAGAKMIALNGADYDHATFPSALAAREIDVPIYNTQTEGSIPEQIRSAAEQAGVPVVDVSETVPPGQNSFVGWQDAQLTALAKALGVGA